MPSTARQAWRFLLAGAVPVLAADQLSKAVITARLGVYEQLAPIPALDFLFSFTLTHNTGGAFSVFPQAGNALILTGLLTLGVILFYAAALPPSRRAERVALGSLLGGALGNLVDRLRWGYVVDFLHINRLPVFNLADLGIVGGVSLLLLLTWRQARRAAPAPADYEGKP